MRARRRGSATSLPPWMSTLVWSAQVAPRTSCIRPQVRRSGRAPSLRRCGRSRRGANGAPVQGSDSEHIAARRDSAQVRQPALVEQAGATQSRGVTKSGCHRVGGVTQSGCHTVGVSHSRGVTQSGCHTVGVSHSRGVTQSGCHTVGVSHSRGVTQSGCHTVGVSHSRGVTQSGCHTVGVLHSGRVYTVGVSHSRGVTQSGCHTVGVSHSRGVTQSGCHTVGVSHSRGVTQSGCHTVGVSHSRGVTQSGCHTVGVTVSWLRTSATGVSRRRRHMSRVIGERGGSGSAMPGHVEGTFGHRCVVRRASVRGRGRCPVRDTPGLGLQAQGPLPGGGRGGPATRGLGGRRPARRDPPPETVELVLRLREHLAQAGLDAGADTIAWHLTHHHQTTSFPGRPSNRNPGRGRDGGARAPEATEVLLRPLPGRAGPTSGWQSDFTHYRLTRPDGDGAYRNSPVVLIEFPHLVAGSG